MRASTAAKAETMVVPDVPLITKFCVTVGVTLLLIPAHTTRAPLKSCTTMERPIMLATVALVSISTVMLSPVLPLASEKYTVDFPRVEQRLHVVMTTREGARARVHMDAAAVWRSHTRTNIAPKIHTL